MRRGSMHKRSGDVALPLQPSGDTSRGRGGSAIMSGGQDKIKLRIKFKGQWLDRKAVFFRPCAPEQIEAALKMVCGIADQASRIELCDDDGDVVCISDSLQSGNYSVQIGQGSANAGESQSVAARSGRGSSSVALQPSSTVRGRRQSSRASAGSLTGLAENIEFRYLFKFIIVGSVSVGKSCLLLQFTDKRFKESHEATIGVDFGSQLVRIGDDHVKIQIWDTAGQEDFRAITRAYYREAAAALLVYDVSNRGSFREIQTWLDAVRANTSSPHVALTLVGNKCDLGESSGGAVPSKRRVKISEGERFAQEYGMDFIETSAKTGRNVHRAFEMTARTVLGKIRSKLVKVGDPASGIRPGNTYGGGFCWI
tara:strand:+ start:445 stop:1548 length:1104 start_codon:yes stop_codon:yes gene_type:complete